MLAAAARDITIDARSGAVEGASFVERSAVALLRGAAVALKPLHNFGFSYVARFIRRALMSSRQMGFVSRGGSSDAFRYCDPYWAILAEPNYPYETSVRALVVDARDVEYGFIDGGSNHGYWSIIVSGPDARSKRTVAIEAAPDTFKRLDDNCGLNERRFVALHKAIGASSGDKVAIYGAKHEARSTVAPSVDATSAWEVETISVDDLAALPFFEGIDKFLVKLDVEGVEIPAFAGASRLLDSDAVFVFEDHGSDANHENTRHVMDNLKLRVFWLGEGGVKEISDAAELAGIKKSSRRGYDMVATRSPFWLARLDRLVAGPAALQ